MRKMAIWSLVWVLLSGTCAFAQDSESHSILIGHNVTPTTETLREGDTTIGTYAIAYGLTDRFFVATSPWIWLSYNTANVHLKYGGNITENQRLAFFASYFESYDSTPLLTQITGGGCRPGDRSCQGPPGSGSGGGSSQISMAERYQWKSYSLHGLYSYHFSQATTNVNLHYGYFYNDDMAYSIRMDPGSDDIRDQVDLTTLTSFPLYKSNYFLNFEIGGLGLNYIEPYLQIGSSIAYKSNNWFVQLGASYTAKFSELGYSSTWSPGRYDSRRHYSESTGEYYYFRYLQTALHPEVQLQYSF